MKKLLLATALAAVSLTGVKAEAGKGFYVVGQAGAQTYRFALESGAKIWVKDGDKYTLKEETDVAYDLRPAAELNWGYSHRFANDMTLGFEATGLISPAIRVGYMVNGNHHLALGVHYAVFSRFVYFGMTASDLKDKNTAFDLKFETMSGAGVSLSYDYYTQSTGFVRFQVRGDYYGLEGAVPVAFAVESRAPFILAGKATMLDITASVGWGMQW